MESSIRETLQLAEDRKGAAIETGILIFVAMWMALESAVAFQATDFVSAANDWAEFVTFFGTILSGGGAVVLCITAFHTLKFATGQADHYPSPLSVWFQLAHHSKPLGQCFLAWAVHMILLVAGIWSAAVAVNVGWPEKQNLAFFLFSAGLAFASFIWVIANAFVALLRGRA